MPLLFFRRKRRIQVEHAVGQQHLNPFLLEVHTLQIRLSVRDLVCFRSCPDNQQRRFPGAELHILNFSDLAVTVEDYASNQIADISPTRLKLGALLARHLKLAANEFFRVGNRIHAREFQNQATLVRPKFFNSEFAPVAVFGQGPQPYAFDEPVWDVAVQLNRNFAAPSLRLEDAGESNELVGYPRLSSCRFPDSRFSDSRFPDSRISSVKRL